MSIVLRLLLIAGAFWLVTELVPGIRATDEPLDYLVIAVVFALVNLLVKPLAQLLSLPFILLTVGLFLIVVNAAMLGLTALLTSRLSVDGIGAALVGALVISAVTWVGERVLGLHRD